MSTHVIRVTPQDYAPPSFVNRMAGKAIIPGIVAAIALVVCAFIFPHGWAIFLRAWLYSFLFWLGLTLGSLVLLMIQYTSGGNWGRVGRRFWEAAASLIPFMFLCWLPIAIGMKELFPWSTLTRDVAIATLGNKARIYLTPFGFWFRGVVYFIGWYGLYWFLRRWADREEAGLTVPAEFPKVQNVSGAGIVFYAVTITLASIDWSMSLDPKFFSTVYGMIFMVGEVLTALCFTVWLIVKFAPVEPVSRMFKIDFLHDFGKLTFAFVVLWAYVSFSQWLIIWSGNLLIEIRWYLIRLRNGWQFFGMALIFIHFVLPFAILLSRNIKRQGPRLIKIIYLVLLMRLIDLIWFTAPNFYPGTEEGLHTFGVADVLMYILAPIAIGGIWLWAFFTRLSKRSLMPVNDPQFVAMLEAKHG